MKALVFFLAYPFIFLAASLPFRLLYGFSDVLYWLLKATGYRRRVVMTNLQNSFPEKSQAELAGIAAAYYRYLCDLLLETLKTMRMTPRQAKERCLFVDEPFLDDFYKRKQSFIIVMGHYGNWEWAGPSFTLNTKHQLVVIYRPLSNPWFDRMMVKMRTKHGTRICPVKNTLRDMVANRGETTATAFLADQAATKKDAYWTTFLNQDTAVFTGPEKLARKFNYPVVYIGIQRLKRGLYEVRPELLISNPSETGDGYITEVFTRRLEADIQKNPVIWLWSHRRWKHKRTPVASNP